MTKPGDINASQAPGVDVGTVSSRSRWWGREGG